MTAQALPGLVLLLLGDVDEQLLHRPLCHAFGLAPNGAAGAASWPAGGDGGATHQEGLGLSAQPAGLGRGLLREPRMEAFTWFHMVSHGFTRSSGMRRWRNVW